MPYGVFHGVTMYFTTNSEVLRVAVTYLRCGVTLKGLAMIFDGQENPFIIFRSKEIYICFKTNNKIPINLLK